MAAETGVSRLPSRLCVLGICGLASASVDDVLDSIESRSPSPAGPLLAVADGDCLWLMLDPAESASILEAAGRLIHARDKNARAMLSADVSRGACTSTCLVSPTP